MNYILLINISGYPAESYDYLILKNILINNNYTVIETTNIDDALEKAKNVPINIIICCCLATDKYSTTYISIKLGQIGPKFRMNLHTQNCIIIACFTSEVYVYYLHWLSTRGVDCCLIMKDRSQLACTERELLSTIKIVKKDRKL
ncbi:MAG: hypothetical protein WBA93_00305 [Microcoleaceae cyanobacterium]